MSDEAWIWGVRAAGAFHLITVALAHFTPIPANWEENLAKLPDVHRRFAVAQNVFIGAAMVFAGLVSLLLARDLVAGAATARAICAAIALWWGGRLIVLPWLRVWPELRASRRLRVGFVFLHAECAAFAVAYRVAGGAAEWVESDGMRRGRDSADWGMTRGPWLASEGTPPTVLDVRAALTRRLYHREGGAWLRNRFLVPAAWC